VDSPRCAEGSTPEADGEAEPGEVRFLIGTVFDVSQTDPDDGAGEAEEASE